MLTGLKQLATAVAAVVLMAGSTQAATVIDGATGDADKLSPAGVSTAAGTDVKHTAVPEPATMMLLGTALLMAFRARHRQA